MTVTAYSFLSYCAFYWENFFSKLYANSKLIDSAIYSKLLFRMNISHDTLEDVLYFYAVFDIEMYV